MILNGKVHLFKSFKTKQMIEHLTAVFWFESDIAKGATATCPQANQILISEQLYETIWWRNECGTLGIGTKDADAMVLSSYAKKSHF